MSTIMIKQCDWPGCLEREENVRVSDVVIVGLVAGYVDVCERHFDSLQELTSLIRINSGGHDKLDKENCLHAALKDGVCLLCGFRYVPEILPEKTCWNSGDE